MNELEFAAAARKRPEDDATAAAFMDMIFDDYETFVHAIWINRKLERVSVLDAVARDMCRWAATGPRRRGVLAFRGEGKTHKVTACLATYRLRRDPQRKVFIVSKSKTEAQKTVALIKAWLPKVWFLEDLTPVDNGETWRRNNASQIDVGPATEHRQPSITAIGVDGQIEGNRAHTIIPDDCETKKNTKTADARDELLRLCNEFTNVLYPDNNQTIDPVEIVVVGTPKHEETLYVKLIDQGFKFQSYPIVYPRDDEKVIGLAPFLQDHLTRGIAAPGDPTCPLRFNLHEIADRRAGGYLEFAMEFMLIADLAKSNRHPLRLADLIVYPCHRDKAPVSIAWGHANHNGSTAAAIQSLGFNQDRLHHPIMVDGTWTPYEVTKAGLDPSGVGTDKQGLAIASALAGNVWVKFAKGIQGGADDNTLDYIASTLRTHNAAEVLVETNNDVYGLYRQALERAIARHALEAGTDPAYPNGWNCSVVPHHATMQKELRIIQTLEPVFSSHRAVFDPSVFDPPAEEPTNDLQHQITRLTKDRKCLPEDGLIDALEIVIRDLTGNSMARSQSDSATSARDRHREKLMDKWREISGQPARKQDWFGRDDGRGWT